MYAYLCPNLQVTNSICNCNYYTENKELNISTGNVEDGSNGSNKGVTVNDNVNGLTSTIGTSTKNVSQENFETDTNHKSSSKKNLCQYIDNEDNIKDSPVPAEDTGEIFSSEEGNEIESERDDLEEKEESPAYGIDGVPFFDEFVPDIDDDDDKY